MLGTIFLLALRSIRRHMLRSFLTILGTLLSDILLALLDPRIRLGRG